MFDGFAQVEGATAGDELTWSAVTAWATAKFIEFLKQRAWFPWLTQDSERANRIISWLAAAGMSIGLAWSFDAATGEFVLRGTVSGLVSGVGHMVRQVMLQEIAYKKFIRKPEGG